MRLIGLIFLAQTKKVGKVFSVTLTGLEKVTLGREKLKREVLRFSSIDFAPLIPLVNDFLSASLESFQI